MVKKIGFICSALVVSGLIFLGSTQHFGRKNESVVEESKNPLYMEITASYDSIYDNSNTDELEGRSDLILIGKVKAVDGVINFSPELNEYIMTSTIGTIQVEDIIKTDGIIMKDSTFSFIRVGGTISVSEYEKSLTPRQIIRQGIDKLTQEEKENSYVKFAYEDDIEIEEGKDYLMYLKYEPKMNKYRIIGMEYGLKEYKASTNQVKNNQNQKWEQLRYDI